MIMRTELDNVTEDSYRIAELDNVTDSYRIAELDNVTEDSYQDYTIIVARLLRLWNLPGRSPASIEHKRQ